MYLPAVYHVLTHKWTRHRPPVGINVELNVDIWPSSTSTTLERCRHHLLDPAILTTIVRGSRQNPGEGGVAAYQYASNRGEVERKILVSCRIVESAALGSPACPP